MDDWGYPPWQNGNLHRSWIAGASWCQLVPGVFGSPRIHPVMAPGIARASHRSSPVCARPCRTGPSLRIPRHRRRPAKAKQRTGKRPTMWGPPVISWFRFAPATIVISTTNYSDIGVIGTNLAIQRGPHIPRFSLKKLFARALDFSGSKGFGASKPSKKPLRSIKSCCNGVASDSRRGVKSEKRWTVSSSPAKPLEIPSIAALMVAESWTLNQYEPVIKLSVLNTECSHGNGWQVLEKSIKIHCLLLLGYWNSTAGPWRRWEDIPEICQVHRFRDTAGRLTNPMPQNHWFRHLQWPEFWGVFRADVRKSLEISLETSQFPVVEVQYLQCLQLKLCFSKSSTEIWLRPKLGYPGTPNWLYF